MADNLPPTEPNRPDSPGSPQVSSTSSGQAGLPGLWSELKRRKVMRVAITYAVVAWLMIQVSATVFPQLGIPDWAAKLVTLVLLIGFPIALIIAWAFELSPDGIKTTKSAREEQGDAPVSKKQQRKRNWIAIGFAASLPTLIFGILAAVFFVKVRTAEAEITASEQEEYNKSIAVLPLANMSPDPNNAFFADGVHEDILTNLSKIRDLLVIGRTSTLQYRDTTKTLPQIGSELDVRYLLEGSVRREGDQVRVTVQLIDSQKRGHIWAENYNRSLDDIFAIQSEVAQTIAEKLHAVLLPSEKAEIERRPTENTEAWDYFLRSRQIASAYSIPLLESAVALDPNFAEAWAALARSRTILADSFLQPDTELLASGQFALDQAMRTGAGLPDIPWAKGRVLRLRPESSIEHFLEALAIDPGFIEARRNLAARYVQTGRFTEAIYHYEQVLRADPFHVFAILQLSTTYCLVGTPDKALSLLEKYPGLDTRIHENIAVANYIKTADKDAYAAAFGDEKWKLRKALLQRNYRIALGEIEAGSNTSIYSLIDGLSRGGSFRIYTQELLAALLWYEIGDKDRWLAEANKAAIQLGEPIESYSMFHYAVEASLAICYALQNERELMESSITKVREQTRSSEGESFRYQVKGEMYIAICYLILGEKENAIRTLEAASKIESYIFFNRELDLWFIFDRLRGNPRFDALLEG